MAWDACMGPTSSKAMGAMMVVKKPSQRPRKRQMTMTPSNPWHWGIIMQRMPNSMKDATWGDKSGHVTGVQDEWGWAAGSIMKMILNRSMTSLPPLDPAMPSGLCSHLGEAFMNNLLRSFRKDYLLD